MTASGARPLAANLRRLRTAEGMTAVDLARLAGIGRATLTQLEAGEGNPTLETLYSLAHVLGVPLADLIADPPASARPRVLRAGEGVHASGRAVEAWLLHRWRGPSLVLELYAVRIRTGVRQQSAAHPPGTREHLHLHAGAARVGAQDAPLELAAGDYADYPADTAHQYEAVGAEPATATLCIVTPLG